MTPTGPYERELIPLEKIRKQLINQMTDMNKKDIESMADIIINLIMQVRDFSNSNKKGSVQSERSDRQN